MTLRRLTTMTLLAILAIAPAARAAGGFGADRRPAAKPVAAPGQALATFAGGCFWCMEPPFEKLPGVVSVTSGYTGGSTQAPTYEQVTSGRTGHYEAVQIVYDPKRVTYAQLLDTFWRNIDPTQDDGQFCDRGTQYRTAIYWHDATQKRLAESSLAELRASKRLTRGIVTRIAAIGTFWPAENYHQDYYRTHPDEYRAYRAACRRDARLRDVWGKDAASH
jgi:peptide-methionine (S)-S-oxide reductase